MHVENKNIFKKFTKLVWQKDGPNNRLIKKQKKIRICSTKFQMKSNWLCHQPYINDGTNYTKLVLKPFAGLSISLLCIAVFISIILFQFTWCLPSILVHYAIYLHSSATNEMRSGVANITYWPWTTAAVYTVANTIIYLKAVKYLIIRPRQIYETDLEFKIRVWKIEDWMLHCWMFNGCEDPGLLY